MCVCQCSKRRWFGSCRTSIMCSTCSSATTSSCYNSSYHSSDRWQKPQLTSMAGHQLTVTHHHRLNTAMTAVLHSQRWTHPGPWTREVFQMACRSRMLLMPQLHQNWLMTMQTRVSTAWFMLEVMSAWLLIGLLAEQIFAIFSRVLSHYNKQIHDQTTAVTCDPPR